MLYELLAVSFSIVLNHAAIINCVLALSECEKGERWGRFSSLN